MTARRFCALRCIQSVFKIICFVKNDNDHALKYKCKEEWDGLFDESRMFCGLPATLETADRSLKKNFDDFAYNHYKNKNWQAMLRTKYRLHFENKQISSKIIDVLNKDNGVAKKSI